MRIEIDRTSCEGTGYCTRVDATLFVVRDGIAELARDPATTDASSATGAERLCPSGSIVVYE
jgi:ferredoxin